MEYSDRSFDIITTDCIPWPTQSEISNLRSSRFHRQSRSAVWERTLGQLSAMAGSCSHNSLRGWSCNSPTRLLSLHNDISLWSLSHVGIYRLRLTSTLSVEWFLDLVCSDTFFEPMPTVVLPEIEYLWWKLPLYLHPNILPFTKTKSLSSHIMLLLESLACHWMWDRGLSPLG